ncbi:Transcriptional activator protein acu-15 [Choanephora cucurbitarum]|uniref:Transcriptional activator protein acu-15 n=1 Tax=Choanephora cucurbitarum TaxID=101091 RepID=A0A1C7N9S6_9FUNG|nr:Transcriptional activator protein acu-15 [Choanephora cucurbitarum]
MSQAEQNDQSKRKRLTTACNVCRRKKIKCDGIQPTCGKCAKFNLECTYTTVVKKRGPRQGHIDSLEKRLRKMEEIITSKNPDIDSSPPSQTPLPLNPPQTIVTPTLLPLPLPESSGPMNATNSIPDGSSATNELAPDQMNSWPPIEVIDHLLPIFVKHLDLFSPIVETDKIVQSIRNKTCNLFLLLAVLSLASRFSDRHDLVTCPRWLSGEKFSGQARKMLMDVTETPCIEHLQGLLVLLLHEYGCARGPRVWRYIGMAIRMALELNLHKELILEQEITTMSLDTWFWHETRRKVLWRAFAEDKVISGTTGRPQMLDAADISTFLPIWHTSIDLNTVDTLYQQSLDRTQLVRYITMRDPHTRQATGFHVSFVDLSIPTNLPYFFQVGLESRLIEQMAIMGKICNLINRGYITYNSSSATAKIDEDMIKIERLNTELDSWYERLPFSLRNTPANLDQFRHKNSSDASQFIVMHVLHNGLVVLLNRLLLALPDIPKLKSTSPFTQEAVHRSIDRCRAAADNVAVMIKDLSSKFDIAPPLSAYFVYVAATVMVSNIFSDDPALTKKSETALNEFYRYLGILKPNWAMADKLLFLIQDLYAVHQKAYSTYELRQNQTENTRSMPRLSIGRLLSLNSLPAIENNYPNGSNWPNRESTLPVLNDTPAFSLLSNRSNPNVSSFDTWLQEQQLLQRKQ